MILVYSKTFIASYAQLLKHQPRLLKTCQHKLLQFSKNPKIKILQDHQLVGKYRHKRAFSITKAIRVVYQPVDHNTVRLLKIGTHDQVYQ